MTEASYIFIHGWVDDVMRDATVQEAHRIRVRLADGRIADLSISRLLKYPPTCGLPPLALALFFRQVSVS